MQKKNRKNADARVGCYDCPRRLAQAFMKSNGGSRVSPYMRTCTSFWFDLHLKFYAFDNLTRIPDIRSKHSKLSVIDETSVNDGVLPKKAVGKL